MLPARSLVVVLVSLLCVACGASRSSARRARPVDRNLILGDELRQFGSANLLDALRNLRPQWLRPSSPVFDPSNRDAEGPVVYLDGRRFGTVRSLGLIRVPSVLSVRFYSPSEAHGRFGPGHLQGAIDVTSAPEPL